ncbi:MAG: hypothetical protein JW697_08015 [Kosmotogaceae bacterium]|nr:hypothetical protein [Kosmotogaceae bacterium]
MRLEILSFGGFRLLLDGVACCRSFCGSQKACEFFAFLLANHTTKIPNEKIFELFWPGMNYEKAKQNLNSTIYLLRKALIECTKLESSSSIVTNARSMTWVNIPEGAVADFIEFEVLLEEAHKKLSPESQVEKLKEAVELYKGDFMSDFGFSSWVKQFQRHYLYLEISAITELRKLLITLNRFSEAMTYNERLILLKPSNHAARKMRDIISDTQSIESEIESVKKMSYDLETSAPRNEKPDYSGSNLDVGAKVLEPGPFFKRIEKMIADNEEVYLLIVSVSGGSEKSVEATNVIQSEIAGIFRERDLIVFTSRGACIMLEDGNPSSVEKAKNRLAEDDLYEPSMLYSVKVHIASKAIRSISELEKLKNELL